LKNINFQKIFKWASTNYNEERINRRKKKKRHQDFNYNTISIWYDQRVDILSQVQECQSNK
jgi:hypothetical protein